MALLFKSLNASIVNRRLIGFIQTRGIVKVGDKVPIKFLKGNTIRFLYCFTMPALLKDYCIYPRWT